MLWIDSKTFRDYSAHFYWFNSILSKFEQFWFILHYLCATLNSWLWVLKISWRLKGCHWFWQDFKKFQWVLWRFWLIFEAALVWVALVFNVWINSTHIFSANVSFQLSHSNYKFFSDNVSFRSSHFLSQCIIPAITFFQLKCHSNFYKFYHISIRHAFIFQAPMVISIAIRLLCL